jgi:hypothetical protein
MKQIVNGVVVEMTQEEIDEYNQMIADIDEQRIKGIEANTLRTRDFLLIQSDWTMLPDAPTDKKAWKAYRQALRDITQQPGFPDNIVWPTKPTDV